MKRALALLLGGGLGLARAVELPFQTCGEDKLGVERIEASEYPLKPNDAVSLSVAFAPKVGLGWVGQRRLAGDLPNWSSYASTNSAPHQLWPASIGRRLFELFILR